MNEFEYDFGINEIIIFSIWGWDFQRNKRDFDWEYRRDAKINYELIGSNSIRLHFNENLFFSDDESDNYILRIVGKKIDDNIDDNIDETKVTGTRDTLYIYNWAYYTPYTVIEKFEKEFNVRVIFDEFASNEEMFTKIMAGGSGYDIVFPTGDYVQIMVCHDLLVNIDHSKILNIGNIDPLILQKSAYDPLMEYSVPYYYGAVGIIVNTARVPNFNESWSIFAREDLRSRMTMLDDLREVIGGALIYLGYSVNTQNPDEIIAAKDLINNEWKPNLVRFDSYAFGKGYANGDFWVVHGYAEAVFEEIVDDPKLLQDTVFFIPREGSTAYIDSMVILKESQNIELAHAFIDFIHRPEIYAEFVDTFGFPATVNVPARQFTTSVPFYSVEELINTELVDDIGHALNMYTDAWFNSIRLED